MDESSVVTQQYYIATPSSPADDRSRVLKYGKLFAVFDRHGDMKTRGLGEQGLFYQGTRYLSRYEVHLWGSKPLLLSSTIEANNFLFTADLTNLDVARNNEIVIPRGTLHLLRSKFLWQGVLYEEFKFVNYGMSDLHVPFHMAIDCDFADIFEVRGSHREARGHRLPEQIEKNRIIFSYQGLDRRVRETRIQCLPEPKSLSASGLQLDFSLRPFENTLFQVAVCCDSHGSHSVGYSRALASASAELKAATETFPQLSSSNSRFNEWMKRSIADVQMMTIGNPEANYPYAGVPWFSTVFGRDGIITALQTLWMCPWIARGVLEFLASTQAIDKNPEVEAEPGKILHEMRRGEMAALGEVPFGKYYGSVDATPLFIMLAGAYFDQTEDVNFARELWPHIELALEWIDHFGDVDGDGFVEYSRHSNRGLIQQGWKDSNDSVFHSDGRLAQAPIALCEVQGYVYAAKLAAAKISTELGDAEHATELQESANRLRMRFEDAFWCPDLSVYALALDGEKKPCRVRTSNAGQCLYTGIAAPARAGILAQTLLGNDFFSGWGVRTVACEEPRYNPLSYHNGSIWPHDNSLIAAGLARYGFKNLAGRVWMGLLDLSDAVDLHRLPELFCGLDRRAGEGPTLYPVACSPQAWAAAAGFMVVQACLGISIQEKQRRVSVERPYLPEGIPQLWIKNLRCGEASLDLCFDRRDDRARVQLADKRGNVELKVL